MSARSFEQEKIYTKNEVIQDINKKISRRDLLQKAVGFGIGVSGVTALASATEFFAFTNSASIRTKAAVRDLYPQPDEDTVVKAEQTVVAFQTPVAHAIRTNQEHTIPTQVVTLGVKDADTIRKTNDESIIMQEKALKDAGLAQKGVVNHMQMLSGTIGVTLGSFIEFFLWESKKDEMKLKNRIENNKRVIYTKDDIDEEKFRESRFR